MRSSWQNRTRNVTYFVRQVLGLQLHLFHWILCAGSYHGSRRCLQRSYRRFNRRWNHSQNQSTKHCDRDWWLRKSLSDLHFRVHLHRWWRRNGHKSWIASFRYGVRTVPPNWYLRSGMPYHWGMQRIRRSFEKRFGREIHVEICSIGQRFGFKRYC